MGPLAAAGERRASSTRTLTELQEIDPSCVALVTELLSKLDHEKDQSLIRISESAGGRRGEGDLNEYSIFEGVELESRGALVEAAVKHLALDRAIGSVCGMGVGDALGHPFEFQGAQNEVGPTGSHFDLATMTFIGE